MLRKQRRQDFELLCVDSGSTDGTWEALQAFKPDIIYQIKPDEYIPGKVLNDAVAKTKGDVIVFNNADCIPQNEFWLENLVAGLESTPERCIIAAFANQLPRPDAIPLVQKDYERAFGDGSVHKTWRHFFSLASSAVSRDIIIQYPFNPDIRYSEDIEWSWRMKKLGKSIIYAQDARVEHSHNYDLKQLIKRYKGEGRAEKAIYGEEYAQDQNTGFAREFDFIHSVVLATGMETLRDWIWLARRGDVAWMLKSPVYRFLQRLSAFRGRTEP
jgi:rhamnosyltransferase